jgi:hypothetical protein
MTDGLAIRSLSWLTGLWAIRNPVLDSQPSRPGLTDGPHFSDTCMRTLGNRS